MALEKDPAKLSHSGFVFLTLFNCTHCKPPKSSPLKHPFYPCLMATASFVQLRRGYCRISGSVYHT